MLFNWLWATVPSEVNLSMFDFFSFGHICMGIVVFALLSLISTLRNLIDPKNFKVKMSHWLAFLIGTIVFGIFWEFIENTILYEWGLKYQNRQDSIVNAISDIILVGLGGLLCLGCAYFLYEKIKKYEFVLFYIFDSLTFVLFYIIYLTLQI